MLDKNKLAKTLDFKKLVLTEEGRKEIVESFKKIMTLGPKEMWFGKNGTGASVFTTSNKDYGVSMSEFKKDGTKNPKYTKEKADAFNQLKQDLIDIRNDKTYTNYGPKIAGVTDYTVSSYNTLLKTKQVAEFNATVSLIHLSLIHI